MLLAVVISSRLDEVAVGLVGDERDRPTPPHLCLPQRRRERFKLI